MASRRSLSAPSADRLVRAEIARHLVGPAFAAFLARETPPAAASAARMKAAPVALLSEALRERLGATAGVLELTDRAAGRLRRRRGDVPAARYAAIQQLVDEATPRRRDGGWVFEGGGWELAVKVENGVARVASWSAVS